MTQSSEPGLKTVTFSEYLLGNPTRGIQPHPMGNIVLFLRSYLTQHWDVLGHAQIRDPALGMLALMEKLRVDAPGGRSPINRQQERANGGVRVHRRS